jgi:hypothetical protein
MPIPMPKEARQLAGAVSGSGPLVIRRVAAKPIQKVSTRLIAAPAVFAVVVAGGVSAVAAPAGAAPRDAVLTVDTTADLPGVAAGRGVCRDTAGTCSLRAAVKAADASLGHTTINLPAGHYRLTIPPRPPHDNPLIDFDLNRGALKLLRPITIVGGGTRQTTVDGTGITRVFANWSNSALTDLTITGGFMPPISPLLPLPIGGGGMANIGVLRLQRVAVSHNHADYGAGVFNYPLSTLTIRDSVVNGNSGLEAAGIRFDSNGLVVNTTITGNTAVSRADRPGTESGVGAGIDARGATPSRLRIVNSTIAGNSASKSGGGINVSQGYPPYIIGLPLAQRVSLQNTIVANNTDATGTANCSRLGLVNFRSQGHNLASDRTCPFRRPSDLQRTNPRLGALADNGGPTDTLALRSGSPAINAGGSLGCPATDQRGVPRPAGHCDIGAFQLAPAS